MSRVTQETLNKLHAFFDSLDPEVKGKCALCNETLTHIVKLAEVQTGAGTATVTRELAARVNEGAAQGDVVSGDELRGRVRAKELGRGRSLSGHCDQINPNQSRPITEWSDTDEENNPTNKPKQKEIEKRPRREPEDNRITTAFFKVYDEMKWVIVAERKAGWPGMAKDTATQYVQSLQNLIDMGE
jgi:hypothetical protein